MLSKPLSARSINALNQLPSPSRSVYTLPSQFSPAVSPCIWCLCLSLCLSSPPRLVSDRSGRVTQRSAEGLEYCWALAELLCEPWVNQDVSWIPVCNDSQSAAVRLCSAVSADSEGLVHSSCPSKAVPWAMRSRLNPACQISLQVIPLPLVSQTHLTFFSRYHFSRVTFPFL